MMRAASFLLAVQSIPGRLLGRKHSVRALRDVGSDDGVELVENIRLAHHAHSDQWGYSRTTNLIESVSAEVRLRTATTHGYLSGSFLAYPSNPGGRVAPPATPELRASALKLPHVNGHRKWHTSGH